MNNNMPTRPLEQGTPRVSQVEAEKALTTNNSVVGESLETPVNKLGTNSVVVVTPPQKSPKDITTTDGRVGDEDGSLLAIAKKLVLGELVNLKNGVTNTKAYWASCFNAMLGSQLQKVPTKIED